MNLIKHSRKVYHLNRGNKHWGAACRIRRRALEQLSRHESYLNYRAQITSSITAQVILRQYSKWVSTDYKRMFIVLDVWHGLRTQTTLLDVQKEEVIYFETAKVKQLILDKELLPF